MFHLHARQALREEVGGHVFCATVEQDDDGGVDGLTQEVVADVDVFRAGVVRVVTKLLSEEHADDFRLYLYRSRDNDITEPRLTM
ncbi:hypothetical protein SCP_1403570 [Sparassis crispa]|uniref:Uncharacterized protein n=1 Tax=Sparassis crispa TaxID=139825 RepID=A0A401H3I3_9APHY|nr:hypothetical protein SCP_1403570 [Sparassis crispa]GBE88949.1 hypothetical protein SCP_1403570 [Sparassis crispa]